MEPTSIGQLGHLLAILIQGQVEAFKTESRANVRTPYARRLVGPMLRECDWETTSEMFVDSSGLADGTWVAWRRGQWSVPGDREVTLIERDA